MWFILVDRILKFEKGKSVVAVKNVSLSEDFFVKHPSRGIFMPRTFVIEALAQAAGWLIRASLDFKKIGLLVALGSLEFNGFVRPGDQLILEAELESLQEEAGLMTCRAKVMYDVVAEIDHCVFSLIDANQLDDPEKEKQREWLNFGKVLYLNYNKKKHL